MAEVLARFSAATQAWFRGAFASATPAQRAAHAVCSTKRGAHLAISLERLDALLDRPAQRIGLSATVRPSTRSLDSSADPGR